MIKLKRIFQRKVNLKYYEGIEDMPIWNWFKVSETNQLKYLLIKDKKELSAKEELVLSIVWDSIYYEFLERYGVPQKMQQVLSLRREILKLQTKIVCNNRKDLQAMVHIKSAELEALQVGENKKQLNTVTAYVSKNMNFRINEKETTVKEFYDYLNMIQNER